MDKKEPSSRLSTGQMMALNHGRISLPPSMQLIMDNYLMPPCCLSKPYANLHNPHFKRGRDDVCKIANASRTMAVRKVVASHTDDHIFHDLRKVFASIVKGKDGTVLATMSINRMLIPSNKAAEIGELFFQTMIQCPLQIDDYLKVLFSIKRPDEIENIFRLSCAKKAVETFNNPLKIPDSKISDSETLTKLHRESTCMVLTKLYAYDYKSDLTVDLSKPNSVFSNYGRLKERYIGAILNDIHSGNADAIKILANSLKVLSLCKKYSTIINDYQEDLAKIYSNTAFKLTVRLAIKDYILS